MAAVMNWLSGPWHRSRYDKCEDEPGPSSSEHGLQRGSSYKAEVAAAYKRATYLKQLHLEELKAIRHRQIKATGTEALILQEMDKQHWATIVELNRHKAALLIANDLGLDIDFDAKFWREHEKLVLELPDSLWPAKAAADLNACMESKTSGARRREHFYIAFAGV